MYFAIIQDKSSFITFISAIKGTQKRIASVVLEKCNLCLALDEGTNSTQDLVHYNALVGGDYSVLKDFTFSSADSSVSVLLYTQNEEEYNDYLATNRIDDEITE